MKVVHDQPDLDAFAPGALVPTMGALHDGHASLIRCAAEWAAQRPAGAPRTPVVVTIFVNPTQFGPNEDFARYPRTLDADADLAFRAGADAIFAPPVEVIYPRGLDAARREAAEWDLPPAATEPGLEDRLRPTHFGGVCLVVARLFELCRPLSAYFGEKDWQQLRVVTQMVELERRHGAARRFPDLRVIACPTIREADGLAMSSRNAYLTPDDRRCATGLWRAIAAAREGFAAHRSIDRAEAAMAEVLVSDGFTIDYAVVREAESLLPPRPGTPASALRILVAARIGGVRLIDNAPLGSS